MNPDAFKTLLQDVTRQIGDRALDTSLQTWLNQELGADSPTYRQLKAACEQGVAEGWLCQREGGGLKYGRIFKPDDALQRFSVDVVDMNTLAGPHHAHPLGEIDLIMPLDDTATFDGRGAGWLVYGPGSAHSPTVARGRALVLYLLPEGRIEFTQ
ncbi:hypothetical protein H010_18675 [Hydrogenophaga taeniospiralis CCUG 15921]|uniref:DUF4863 domain-containing protein n=1 Tax=Hydrogenophaga taeniospiralis CCUG 15921 TaxID=1281780 RepID=A0A9X4NU47_9BURK|nr:DUF4863 family protein [Hydrogenophaga taeniospiralis]MDG5977292.1 hypothetical protein [Hydrogenophaga taeniospiralis CCUG 15921]